MINSQTGKRSKKLLLVLISIYVGVLLVLMIIETSLIYPAPPRDSGDWQAEWLAHEEVQFASDDGTRLHGWFCEHAQARHTMLICHGNGEHLADLADELEFFRQRFQAHVMAFDYRGYGSSQGTPFETGILADGQAAQRWLAQRTGQAPQDIVLYGRSLGGAVAVHLAATQGSQALVLDRTFSSMVEVAASHFPWFPVRLLLRNRYDSFEKIKSYHGPLLQFHGSADEVVPFRLGLKLYEACPSAHKQFVSAEQLQHNTPWPSAYYDQMDEFLNSNP